MKKKPLISVTTDFDKNFQQRVLKLTGPGAKDKVDVKWVILPSDARSPMWGPYAKWMEQQIQEFIDNGLSK